ncbi:hypothetical protein [Dechloromonas denitrificans]|uniref:hypothetical protein n=1 Tax=Dechloromonas denitrificans TaxID=281362 RepID=UPI001CF8B8FA|nr:hypothetical protein [Dechloromonas denitrificans]UCV05665.1 hypothetical protein KI611_10610 [Dechloromonas denitrificans]
MNIMCEHTSAHLWHWPQIAGCLDFGRAVDGVARQRGEDTGGFQGQRNCHAFRADMPDIVFDLIAEKQGLEAKKNFKLRYVGSSLDAMQLLVSRRVDHALLAEPAVSMALRKTKSFPVSIIAPDLYRSAGPQ